MSSGGDGGRLRIVAAGSTVVLAAGAGVLTNIVSDEWSWGVGVALGVLVLLGAVLTGWLAGAPARQARQRRQTRRARTTRASGPGSVVVGGSFRGNMTTDVVATPGPTASPGPTATPGTTSGRVDETVAEGPGSIAVGEDIEGDIDTRTRPPRSRP
ncbi:hypothetical protein [Streptomyces xanthophaeus]